MLDPLRRLDTDALAVVATGRERSLFADDMADARERLVEAIQGRRILVIGGAGTIGSATLRIIADYRPAALHIVDQNENGLTEVVRSLRSRVEGLHVDDFRIFPVDYGAPVMRRILAEGGRYDAVLNFAALKHVRSERDVPSLVQMLDTNLVKNRDLMRLLADRGFTGRYFCVSTDKAANPVSLMGASKRIMEHLIFSGVVVPQFAGQVTSARFANVAFSDGSLLHGFIQRLAKRQPIPVPVDTQRYFVSPAESGEICTLATFCTEPGSIVTPDFERVLRLKYLHEVAADFLIAQGLTPEIYTDEDEARRAAAADRQDGRYPILQTPLDTNGEKPYEEFVGQGETVLDIGFSALSAVSYAPAPAEALRNLFTMVDRLVTTDDEVLKSEIVDAFGSVTPEFAHRETGRSLDTRI